jgi:hypothetical protein
MTTLVGNVHREFRAFWPRIDRAASTGLFIAEDDPLLMIEDAPGRSWR